MKFYSIGLLSTINLPTTAYILLYYVTGVSTDFMFLSATQAKSIEGPVRNALRTVYTHVWVSSVQAGDVSSLSSFFQFGRQTKPGNF